MSFFPTICILVQSISHPLNRLTPFIHNAWNSPQVLAAVSQVAGVDLVPVFEYDTGHCNVSVRPDGDTSTPPPSSPPPRGTEAEKDEKEVFGWHEDCFPFVCVVMLSDCSEMVGGETMLKTGNGKLLKVRGPSKVCSVSPSFLATSFSYGQRLFNFPKSPTLLPSCLTDSFPFFCIGHCSSNARPLHSPCRPRRPWRS